MVGSEGVRDTVSEWCEKLQYELSTRIRAENVVTYDGVLLDVTADLVSYEIYRAMVDGWYERQEATLVRKHLPTDIDVIELGAGIGYISTVIDERLVEDRTHLAVEPHPSVVPVLEKTRRLNDGSWITHEAAYHPSAEVVELTLSGDYWSASTGSPEFRTVRVPATSIADLCVSYDISRFALVLDVEGAEYELLLEELDLLVACCPLIIVEFHEHGRMADEYDDDLLDGGFELIGGWDDVCVYRNTTLDDDRRRYSVEGS